MEQKVPCCMLAWIQGGRTITVNLITLQLFIKNEQSGMDEFKV